MELERGRSLSLHWYLSVLTGSLLGLIAIVGLATSALGSNVFEREAGGTTLGQALLPVVIVCAVVLTWALIVERRRGASQEQRLANANVELLRKEVSLEKQAVTDAVTGLYNRRFLYERLGRELRRAQRYGRPLSLILLELDSFKEIYEAHGHQRGDLVLSQFARVLSDSLREPDVPCRFGGEEFALVLPETDPDQALAVAEKLRSRVKDSGIASDLGGEATTVSQGIISFPSADIDNENDMIKKAEWALGEAKSGGRDRIELAEAQQPTMRVSHLGSGPLM